MCLDPVLLDTAFRSHKNVGLAKTPNRFRLGRPETETWHVMCNRTVFRAPHDFVEHVM
jgi:hypothetical protein